MPGHPDFGAVGARGGTLNPSGQTLNLVIVFSLLESFRLDQFRIPQIPRGERNGPKFFLEKNYPQWAGYAINQFYLTPFSNGRINEAAANDE